MNIVDWVVLGTVALFALIGWRTGFIQGLLGFFGFLGGAVLAARLLPDLAYGVGPEGPLAAILLIALVLIAGMIGQGIGALVGAKMRDVLPWEPARWLDSLLGSGLAAAGAIVAAWAIATIILALPENPTTGSVRTSAVLAVVDETVPPEAKQALSDVAGMVSKSGIPIVVGGFTDEPVGSTAPSTGEATTPEVAAMLDSVVKVSGSKPACGDGATGSGYVSTPEHVTTNAHVVAAMDAPRITTSTGETYKGVVVAFEPQIDVAVIYAPGLPLEAVPTTTEARSGTRAAVAGYPGGGDLTVVGAVVRASLASGQALATDIYGNPGSPREAYVLNANVQPGNSGGPLVATDGSVIGLVFAKALEDPGVGYALTAAQFREVSRAAAVAVTPVNTGPCLPE
ncbi:MAG: MarP family serine protease [Actinomycetota bacterium]|nr:MarP family serine protease [Actinomycetota bacterium]